MIFTTWVAAAAFELAAGAAQAPWIWGEKPRDPGYRATIREDEGMGDLVLQFSISDSGRSVCYGSRPGGGAVRLFRNDEDVGNVGYLTNFGFRGLFRPGTEELAYIESADPDAEYVAFGRERIGPFRQVHALAWSPDGKRFGFIAEDLRVHAVVDGVRGRAWNAGGELSFSGDSRSYACWASDERGYFLIVDGEERGPFAAGLSPVWGPTGRRLAFSVRDADGERLIVGDEVSAKHRYVTELVFSANSSSYAYIASDDPEAPLNSYVFGENSHRYRMVWERTPQPEYQGVWDPQLSIDGRTLAYQAWDGSRRLLVVNERALPADSESDVASQFPEGTLMPAPVRLGGRSWVIAGRFRKPVDGLMRTEPGLVYSPDRSRVGFFIHAGKRVYFREESTR